MPAVVVGVAREERLLQPLDPEHRVPVVGVEVEGPAALVVDRARRAERDGVLEAEQAADDDRPARPRAGPRGDQAVAARLDRPQLALDRAVLGDPLVPGDPVGDVGGVALELLAAVHVRRAVVVAHGHPVPAWRPRQTPQDLFANISFAKSSVRFVDMTSITPSPAGLKALGHPVRLRMLGLLRMRGPRHGDHPGDAARAQHRRHVVPPPPARPARLRRRGRRERGNGRDRWWRAAHQSTTHRREPPGDTEQDREALDAYLQAVAVVLHRAAAAGGRGADAAARPSGARATVLSDWVIRLTPDPGAAR